MGGLRAVRLEGCRATRRSTAPKLALAALALIMRFFTVLGMGRDPKNLAEERTDPANAAGEFRASKKEFGYVHGNPATGPRNQSVEWDDRRRNTGT